MVEKPADQASPGSVVEIVDRDGNFAGRGFYNGHSRIALRVLTADPDEAVDAAFFARKIADAVALRRDVLGARRRDRRLPAGPFRGRRPVADWSSIASPNTIVLEYFSAGMFKQRELIRQCLLEQFPGCRPLRLRRRARAEAGEFRLRRRQPRPNRR